MRPAPLLLALLLACAGKATDTAGVTTTDTATDSAADTADSATDSGDTAPTETADSQDSTSTFCADAATMTYANFGRGFLTGNCEACHASTTANRHDAPADVTFDTVDEVWAQADAILDAATTWTGSDPTMPPRGGVSDDDRTRLEWWLVCGTPGT